MSEVVTIRIDKHTKEKIKKHGINVSLTVRKALEEEIRKKEEEDFEPALNKAGKILQKISKDEIVRAVRESRESR